MHTFSRSLRAILLTGVLVAADCATWHLTAGSMLELARAGRHPNTVLDEWVLDRLVVDLGSGLLLVAVTGLAVMVGLSVAATVVTERRPTLAATCRRLTPPACRRLVAVLLGLGLAAPTAVGGWATADQHPTVCGVVCRAQPPSLGGLRLPDLPLTPDLHPAGPVAGRLVVVEPGDSLWRIAARWCGEGAADAQVAVLTQRLYALNRATIGDDPDLIFPGMSLIAPEGSP